MRSRGRFINEVASREVRPCLGRAGGKRIAASAPRTARAVVRTARSRRRATRAAARLPAGPRVRGPRLCAHVSPCMYVCCMCCIYIYIYIYICIYMCVCVWLIHDHLEKTSPHSQQTSKLVNANVNKTARNACVCNNNYMHKYCTLHE